MKLAQKPFALLKSAKTFSQQGEKSGFVHFKFAVAVASLFTASATFAAPLASNALPTGGQVAAGQATISQSGNVMNINQSTQRAVINWNSFNVGSNATVNFNQPNANASTLNRVNGATKSMIDGAVNANGQVIFVNPNGVIFGKGAEVNTGGLVATTMDIKDSDYMNGKNSYSGNGTGKVVNKGTITVNNVNGYIALMAPEVKNEGVLIATLSGNNAIALVSGEKVTLSFNQNQLVNVSVDASTIKSLIANKRLIQTNGGQVLIAANSASDLRTSVINNTGKISADGFSTNGGKISLVAGTVNQSGTVSANSDTNDGGQVVISGKQVNLNTASKTIATGAVNGGQILVGKTNTNTAQSQVNADVVSVAQGAVVDASSTQTGNGGAISIWSQIASNVAGLLKSNGGAISGNGGTIDTSSAGKVTYGQSLVVDTTAPHGKTGNWLTDPLSITIDSTNASVLSNALATTNVTLDATNSACGAIGTCSLNATPVITFLADVYSANPLTSLYLNAQGGSINVNSNITAGQVYAVAQAININGSLNTNGGSNSTIYLAGAAISILGNVNSNGNSSNNTSSGSLNLANTLTSANRRNGQNGLTADANTYISNGGAINIIATGDINIGTNSYISANGINGGNINIVSTAGTTTVNGIVDSLGKSANGGLIAIVGKTQTDLIGALISSEGLTQGGVINLGQTNNLSNGSTLAPPANGPPALTNFVINAVTNAVDSNNSITSSNINLDSQTGVNAPNGNIVVFGDQIQINNSVLNAENGSIAIGRPSYGQGELSSFTAVNNSALKAGKVETSGQVLSIANNTVLAIEWLLDPTSVTISPGALGGSTGGSLASAQGTAGASTITDLDLQAAINAGTSVTITTSGSITQSSALTFAITPTSTTPTLTLNNSSGAVQSISLGAITDNTTASGSGVNIVAISSGGAISVGGAINVKGYISLDNTYQVGGSSPGYLNAANATTSNATTSNAIAITGGTLTAGANAGANGVSLNGISSSGYGVYATQSVKALAGSINITGATSNSYYGIDLNGSLNIVANAGNLNLTGISTSAANGAGGLYLNGSSSTSPIIISASGSLNLNGYSPISGGTSDTPIYAYSVFLNSGNNTTISSSGAATTTNFTKGGFYFSNSAALSGGSFSVQGLTYSAGVITAVPGSAVVTNAVGVNIDSGTITVGSGIISGVSGSYTGIQAVGDIWMAATSNGSTSGAAISLTGASLVSTTGSITLIGTATAYAYGIYLKDAVNISAAQNVSILATTNTSDPGGVYSIYMTGASSGAPMIITSGATINIVGYQANSTNSQDVFFNQVGLIKSGGAMNIGGYQAAPYYAIYDGGGAALVSGGLMSLGGASLQTLTNANGSSNSTGIANVATFNPAGAYNASTYSAVYLAAITPLTVGLTTYSAYQSSGGISIIGSSAAGGTAVNLTSATLTNGTSGNITVIGNDAAAGSSTGINSTGSINQNVNGGSVSFTSNNSINQTGTLTVAANTTGVISNITYDTTSGNNTSSITHGVITVNSGSNTAINLTEKTAGAPITVGQVSLPGFIKLDNTYGCTGANCSPASGFITQANAGSYATSSNGITINGALTAGAYASTTGITINGASTTGQSVYDSGNALISNAGGITISGVGTTASTVMTLNNAMTINNSGNLSVTAKDTAGGGNTGITSNGTITDNVSGGSITFTSNNVINQSGSVGVAANVGSTVSSVTYDTTSGTSASTITSGALTLTAGSTQAINYIQKTAGAAISNSGLSMPGYIYLDNTFGCTGASCTPLSGYLNSSNITGTNTTSSAGVTVSGALAAGSYAGTTGITINGVSSGNYGTSLTSTLTASTGPVVVSGQSTSTWGLNAAGGNITSTNGAITLIGISNTAASTTNMNGVYIGSTTNLYATNTTNGNISVYGTVSGAGNGNDTTAAVWFYGANGGQFVIAGNSLDISGYASGNNHGVVVGYAYPTLLKSGGNLTISGYSVDTARSPYSAIYLKSSPISSGGKLTVEGSALSTVNGIANVSNGVLGTAAYSAGSYGISSAAVTSVTYSGTPYSNYTAVGDIWIAGTAAYLASAGPSGVYLFAPLQSTSGNITIIGVAGGNTAGAASSGVWLVSNVIATTGSITIQGTNSSGSGNDGLGILISAPSGGGVIAAGTTLNLYGVSTGNPGVNTSAAVGLNVRGSAGLLLKSGGDMTIAANATLGGAIYSQNGVVMSSGGNLTMENATTQTLSNANGGSGVSIPTVAVAVPNSSATSTLGTGNFGGVYLPSPPSVSYGGNTYNQITAVGNINISGTAGSTAVGVSLAEKITSTTGSVTIVGSSGSTYGVYDTATISAASGVSITTTGSGVSAGTQNSILDSALITNTGTTGTGVLISAIGNVDLTSGGVTNSGVNGTSITGGYGVAAGTTTYGSIIALGTLTNTGGYISLSTSQPQSASGTASSSTDYIANVINIYQSPTGTQVQASTSTNVSYSNIGGVMSAPSKATMNNINYRVALVPRTISISLASNYSQVYGTLYNSSTATTWLDSSGNTTVSSISGSGGGFGAGGSGSALTNAQVLASLLFSSTIGGNSNNVQSTNLANSTTAVTSSYGTVTVTSGTYTITKAPLTITGTKVYDTNGNFTYANMSVSGAISGETIALTAGTAIASSSGVNVGTYSGSALSSIAISVTGGNALASNYSLPTTGAMSITAAPLTITANSGTKIYGQTLTYGSGSSAFTQVGLLGGQTIGSVTITDTNSGGVSTAAVSGTYALTPSAATGGTFNASNYNITYATGALTISRAPLTITANADTKVYGATKTYGSGSSAFTSSGLISGQSITSVTITDTNSGGLVGAAAGGSYALTPSLPLGSGGFNTANYNITYTPGALTVTKAPLTISGTKIYNANGSFAYSDMSISGGVNGETVSLTAGSATSSGSNVGTYAGTALSGLAIGVTSGNASASNYSLPTTGTMSITAAPLSITASADTKTYGSSITTIGVVYNGTTSGVSLNSVNALGYTVSGLFSGDTVSGVTLSSSGGAVGANASGTAYTVTPSAAIGSGLGNYTIGYHAGTLTVNPALVVITSPTMVYNGSTTFTPGASGVTYTATGVNGQTVVLGGSGTLTNGNVQGGSAMNSTSSLSIASVSGGGSAGNYVLPASLPVVTITPAPITVTLATQTKPYDSTTSAALTAGTSSLSTGDYTISGFVSGQGAYITQTVGSYNSANATTSGLTSHATTVTASLPSTVWTVNSGTNLSNYTLPATVSANGTITKAALSLTANDVTTFIGVAPAPSSLVYSVSGLVGADTNATAFTVGPSVTNTGSIAAAGVTAGAIAVSGTAPNYTVTPYNGTLTVAGNYQLVVAVGNSSKVFGTYNSTSVSDGTVGSQATGVTAGYCTNCGVGVSSPTIISLTVTAPSTPSASWTATDNLTNQGKYSFTVTPSISSYSNSGSYVNVGNYALTPNSVTTVAGYATNYDVNKSIIYTAGTLTVTPLTLTFAPATPTITYNGSTAINSVALTPNNLPTGMSGVVVNGSGAFTSPNASNAAGYVITNAAITGPDAANFAFSSAAAGTTGTTGVINPAAITVSASNTVKTYDTTASTSSASVVTAPAPVLVSGTLYTNSVTGLADTLASVSTVYYDSNPANAPNVGSGNKTVQVSNAAITNGTSNASGNYTITYQNNTTSTINPATIVINGTGTYDGTTNTTTLTATGLNGQTLLISGGTGTMSSANAGTNALTGVAGTLVLANGSGSNAGLASNYTVVNPSLGTAVIAPAAITVSASDTVKTYDATLATSGVSIISAPTPTLISGTLYTNSGTSIQDSLSGGTYAYLDPNAGSGNKSVSVSGVNVLNGSTNVNSNYTITYVNNTTSTINPATIVISGTGTYNGTNALSSFTATGVNGQTLVINGATGTMSSANAGTNAITAITGGTLAGGGSNPGNPANYTIVGPTFGNAVIAPAAITVTASDTVKTYDATTATSGTNVSSTPAPVLLSGTLFSTDAFSGGSYVYVDPNVKNVDGTTNKTVTVSGVAVVNGLNTITSNYTITYVNNTTSTINPAPLTVSGLTNAGSTPYNGTTTIAISGTPSLSGIISGAPVVINGGSVSSGTLASPNAANGVVVTPDLSSLTLNNPNYVIVGPTVPMSTNITPLQLTATIIGSPSMQYNGTTTNSGLTGSNYALTGFISGQGGAVSQPIANYNSADVSSATSITAALTPANITANGGTLLSNYILPTSATGAGSITPAPLTMTANNASTFLGVAPSLSGSSAYTLTGLKGVDTAATAISGAAVTNVASSSNPGAYTNALVPSATSSNYTLTFVPGNLTIAGADQIVIAISSGNNTVTYGTYSSSNVATAGNSLSVSNVSAQYCTNCVSNMGGISPNIISLTITAPSGGSNLWTATDNISPNTSAQGVYNFTITPTVPAGSYSSGNYLNVGSYVMTPGNLTTVAGYSTNYNQSKPVVYTGGTLTVTPLTINIATGPTTTYNGTTTINGAAVTPSNLLSGDALTVAANGTLTSPNANNGGAGYSLTSAVLSGADAANYVFSSSAPGSTGTNATVLRAPITISASNTVKTYDTTTSTSSASVTTAPTPVIVSGTLYANTATGFTDTLASVSTVYYDANSALAPNVGNGNKTVQVSNAAISNNGNSANSNYAITYQDNTTSTINPAQLTISGLTTPGSQTYNNNSAVAISGTPTLSGLLPGTSATISGSVTTGTAANVNVGSNIGVTPNLSGLTLSNPNYVIFGPTAPLSVNITPAPLTISGLTAAGIVYNGGTATTISGTPTLNGAISGAPAVVIGSGSVTNGTFVSPNASPSTVVDPNLSSLVLSGPGASNYTIVGTTSPLTAPITPAPLTVTLAAQTKQYDSTVDATLTSASYTLSGFVSGQGASIAQTAGVYNSPNVVGAVSVTAALSPSNFTANTGTLLSNYILPTSATGPGTITPAPLTMTANNVTTFIGVAPNLAGAYTLTGLLGTDTAATAISNPVVTNTSNATGSGTYAGALVPSASSSNYTLSYVSGALNIASNMQLVINVGTNSVVFGTYNQAQVVAGTAAAQMPVAPSYSANGVSASYCTNCALNNPNPTYVTLTVTAPTSGTTWTAVDSVGTGASQGSYTFTIAPTVPVGSYSTGSYLKVGNYAMTASGVATVAGHSTNYNPTLPVLYTAGSLTVTPLVLQFSSPYPAGGSTTSGSLVPSMQYNGTTNVNNAVLTPSNLPTGMSLSVLGNGSYASPNAGTNVPVSITSAILSGADAANFAFAGPITGTGVITPAPITVSATNAIKTYDNTLAASGSNVSTLPTPTLVSGVLYSVNGVQDALNGGTYAYLDPNAGSANKVLTVSAVAVKNAGNTISSNYTITYVNNTTSTINPAVLTISGLSATGKTYDTTNDAVVAGTPTLTGNTYGASVTLSGMVNAGLFATPNAGNGIAVSPNLSSLALNNPNFVISGLTSPISANITPAPLTVNWASSPSSINGLGGQNLGINGSGQLINGSGGAAGLASNYVIMNPKPAAPAVSSASSSTISSSQSTNGNGSSSGVTSNAVIVQPKSPSNLTSASTIPDMMLVSRISQDQSFSSASSHVANTTAVTANTVDSAATSKASSAGPLLDDHNPVATIVIMHDVTEVKQDLLATFKSDSVSYDIPNPVVLDPAITSAAKPRYEATLLNGDPLPSWLKVDPDTKVLSADNVPVSALPIQIKVRTFMKGKEVKDSVLTIKKL